jgi:hypothetical protein
MAKDNKVVQYKQASGKSAQTGASQKQVEQLREAGRLESVRRVRQFRKGI